MDRRNFLRNMGVAGIAAFTTKEGIEVYERQVMTIPRINGTDSRSDLPEKFNQLADAVETLAKAQKVITQ